ncbi:hypothetical protein P43SY_008570 [Pythium insidiosum]|uniref:Transmembrane protein n=1 Tax=Pythium insidiosum TaxID=114742 RepID=A0AAD5LL53_PYTIN|nr:hypothetical protein P43SY_008570 [Pythium insidiosum]
MRGPTDEAKKPSPVDSSDVDIVVPAPPFTTSSTASSIAELPLGVPDSGRGSGAHGGVAGKPSVGSASDDDSARASAVTPGPASVLDMRDMTIMNDTDLLDVDDDDEEDDDDRVSLLTDDEDMAHDDLDGVDGLGSGGSSSSGRARSHHSEVEEIPAGALTFQVSRASVTRTGVIPCCVFVGRVTWGAVEWEIHFGQKQLLRLHFSVMADLLYHRRAWLPSRGVRLPWTLFREKRAERRIADVPIVQDYVQSLLRHDDIRNSEPLLSFLEVSPSRAMSRYGPSLKEGYVHMRMNGAFQLPLYSCFNRTIEALYRHLYRTWMRIAFIAAVVTFIFPVCLVLVTALPAFVTGQNIAIDDSGASVDEKITVARVIFGLFMVFVMVYSAFFNNMNVMQIFENQRMNVLKGRPGHVWSNDNLRDGDYAPWTDVNGVPINMDKIDLKDFVLDRFKDKKRKHFFSMDHDGWCYARNFSVFQEVRMHNFRKRDKLQHFVTDRLMAQEDETRARGQLSEIRGHLVEFPVHFLAEEILKPSIMPRDIHI